MMAAIFSIGNVVLRVQAESEDAEVWWTCGRFEPDYIVNAVQY